MHSLTRDIIELRVPSRPEYVPIVRTLIADLARRMAFSASAVEDVRVAISEACANVVRHAYSDVESTATEMVVRCSTKDGKLAMEIVDTGQGVVESARKRPKRIDRQGGFGLLLMQNLMDHVSLDSSPDRGTVVRMVKQTSLRTGSKLP